MDSSYAPVPRVALVTGGSRGIGRAVVDALAAEGYWVTVVYSSAHAEAEAAVTAVQSARGRAIAVQADVADETEIAAAFEQTIAAFGGVDVVVHAAGRLSLAPIADLDLAELDSLHRTNIRGTFVVAQQAARHVRSGGAIITFSTSIVGLQTVGYGAYAASKGAVEAITLILARELRGRDITVNSIAPGPTATALFLDGKEDGVVEHIAQQAPLERLGLPDDIASATAFLAGRDGRWVNGQVLRVNGGII